MRALTLEALEVLSAIERAGSFAAAAEQLHKVPSAVTYAVQKLEQELGVQLFNKEGRRAVMTPAARLLVAQGRGLLEAADRLAEAARQAERGWESQLRIAIDSLIDFDVVADALAAFTGLESGTEVRLSEEVLSGAWEAVLEGRADLVVGAPRLPDVPAELEVRSLMVVEFVFAVAPFHPLAQPSRPLSPDDIAPFRAIVVRDTARHRAVMTRRVFPSQPILAVSSIAQKIELQRRGLGVGYLPRHCIERELARGELVMPPMLKTDAPSELVLAWKKGQNGRALRWFVDWFRTAMSGSLPAAKA
ncbi:LysR family transcriptional regulator [Litorivivens sp.]|uniref:LysR family transcriptional regulator n=1 Tax=Litorivivens sp. TaxID=2020868 RepID=UPI003561D15D